MVVHKLRHWPLLRLTYIEKGHLLVIQHHWVIPEDGDLGHAIHIHVTCDIWHLTCDMWHCDIVTLWHLTFDIWHLTFDICGIGFSWGLYSEGHLKAHSLNHFILLELCFIFLIFSNKVSYKACIGLNSFFNYWLFCFVLRRGEWPRCLPCSLPSQFKLENSFKI